MRPLLLMNEYPMSKVCDIELQPITANVNVDEIRGLLYRHLLQEL